MSEFWGKFTKKFNPFKKYEGAAAGAAAAVPVPVQSLEPFEVTCQKFNQFYAMMPLPNGRVRPTFPTFSPPNVPGLDYSFIAYGTPEIEGKPIPRPPQEDFQELFLNQQMFEHYHEILQYFPCEEAINLGTQIKKYGVKRLKKQTSNIHVWQKMSEQYEDIHCVKKSFVYFVFRYIVIPVVERWKSYTDEESEIDEQYLSALLQLELLNSMNKILLPGKRRVYTHCGLPQFREHKQYAHGMNAYSPQEQQVVDSLQQSLEIAKQLLQQIEEQRRLQQEQEQRQRQQEQEQRQRQQEEQQRLQRQRQRQQEQEQRQQEQEQRQQEQEDEETIFGLGGGSKHKRQRSKRQRSKRQRSKRQRSKRQRREQSKRRRQRQKSKKYHK
jgi:hypothetical protein